MSAIVDLRTISDVDLLDRLTAIPYTGAVTDIFNEPGYYEQTLSHWM